MKVDVVRGQLSRGELLVMDGGFGSELHGHGIEVTAPLWSAHAQLSPKGHEATRRIHAANIRAGAQLVIAGTFRTMPYVFAKDSRPIAQARQATLSACRNAHEAREKEGAPGIIIAGSVGPLEDCYSPGDTPDQKMLRGQHRAHAENLAEAGSNGYADLYLAETMITLRETNAALEAADWAGIEDVAVSFCCTPDGASLLSGESLNDAVTVANTHNPLFIGINCVMPTSATLAVQRLRSLTDRPIAVYAQGDNDPSWPLEMGGVSGYLHEAARWQELGAQIIGGCCGTSPAYIAAIERLLADQTVTR